MKTILLLLMDSSLSPYHHRYCQFSPSFSPASLLDPSPPLCAEEIGSEQATEWEWG